MPSADRRSDPAKTTSSARRERRARPCSPSAQRRASARLLLPEPFGPMTALIPGTNSTIVRSAKDLNPCRRRAWRRAGRFTRSVPGRSPGPRESADPGVGGGDAPRRERRGCPAARVRARPRRRLSRRCAASLRYPSPAIRPPTATSTTNCLSWSGPETSASAVVGSFARAALGQLLEATLGALEEPGGASAASSGAASVQSQARAASHPWSRKRAAETASRADASRIGPGATAPLRLALAEPQVVAEVDPAGQPSEAARAHDRRPAR